MARGRSAPCLWTLTVLAALIGCGRSDDARQVGQAGPPRIVASIPPLASWASDLAPEAITVQAVIRPGQSPHLYEPAPGDLAALARADLVVVVGLGLEASLPRRVLPSESVVEMASELDLAPSEGASEHHDHAHASGDAHHHGPIDPHLWLDPSLVERFIPVLADRIRGAMRDAGMADAEIAAVDGREAALLERIRAVDREYAERLAPFAGALVITQHAAWSRLASRYGIEVVGVVQPSEGIEPPPAHLAELVDLARARGVRAIVSEPQLDAAVAGRLAERLGLPVAMLDPLGAEGWEAMMRRNLDALTEALATSGGGGP